MFVSVYPLVEPGDFFLVAIKDDKFKDCYDPFAKTVINYDLAAAIMLIRGKKKKLEKKSGINANSKKGIICIKKYLKSNRRNSWAMS